MRFEARWGNETNGLGASVCTHKSIAQSPDQSKTPLPLSCNLPVCGRSFSELPPRSVSRHSEHTRPPRPTMKTAYILLALAVCGIGAQVRADDAVHDYDNLVASECNGAPRPSPSGTFPWRTRATN